MPHPLDVIIGKYLRACTIYGLVHSLPYAYAMKKPLGFGQEDDALLADRVGLCMLSSGSAPFLWPVFLYEDARAIERFVRRRAGGHAS